MQFTAMLSTGISLLDKLRLASTSITGLDLHNHENTNIINFFQATKIFF